MKKDNVVFSVLNYIAITLLCFSILLPVMWVISTSLIGKAEFLQRGSFFLFPHKLDFGAYIAIFDRGSLLLNAYMISILRVLAGTVLNLIFTSALAYGLSKKYLRGRNICITLIFITMFFGGGLIPTYFLVTGLGLKNSFWALIIPCLINSWNFILMKSFLPSTTRSTIGSLSEQVCGANGA